MLLIGFIGVTFSPIISIIQTSMMTVQAGSVENYTFRELLNNTIWNNMAIFFPMILALVGGHFIDREYVDDTLKNILCIPISMRRMVAGKLCTLGVITILLSLYNFIVTLVVGLLFCRETMAFKECLYGGLQIIGMGICLFIAEMPVIAWCARKQDAFKAGAVLSFVLGYLSIFLKSSVIRNIYPYSAGLSVIQFDTTGFVYSQNKRKHQGCMCRTLNAILISCSIKLGYNNSRTCRCPHTECNQQTNQRRTGTNCSQCIAAHKISYNN